VHLRETEFQPSEGFQTAAMSVLVDIYQPNLRWPGFETARIPTVAEIGVIRDSPNNVIWRSVLMSNGTFSNLEQEPEVQTNVLPMRAPQGNCRPPFVTSFPRMTRDSFLEEEEDLTKEIIIDGSDGSSSIEFSPSESPDAVLLVIQQNLEICRDVVQFLLLIQLLPMDLEFRFHLPFFPFLLLLSIYLIAIRSCSSWTLAYKTSHSNSVQHTHSNESRHGPVIFWPRPGYGSHHAILHSSIPTKTQLLL
jgi:hypothetical protein